MNIKLAILHWLGAARKEDLDWVQHRYVDKEQADGIAINAIQRALKKTAVDKTPQDFVDGKTAA